MADVNKWEGDQGCTAVLDNCGGCRQNYFPTPHRMAAHRRRAPYNMGGVFDSVCDVQARECYAQMVATNTLWLALLPEDTLIDFIRVKVSAIDAVAPATFSVIAQRVNLDTGAVIGAIPLVTPIVGITTATLQALTDTVTFTNSYNDPYAAGGREGARFGLQFTVIPAGGLNANVARIELTVVARDFETVQIPNCRDQRCVINNP